MTKLTSEQQYLWDETIANMFSNPTYTNYLFYAHIIAQLKVQFDDTLRAPAAVNFQYNHYNLFINPLTEIPIKPNKDGTYPRDDKGNEIKSVPGFLGLPLEQRLGVLMHECLHICNNHIGRAQDRDHQFFNYATDCAINQFINDMHLPEGCIYPSNLPVKAQYQPVPEKLTAEQYYEMLDFQDDDGSGSGACGGSGSTIDDHSAWSDSVGDPDLQEDITKGMLEKATTQTQKSRGNVPSEIAAWISNLTRNRQLDWRNLLRKQVGNKKASIRRTLMRPDRRLPDLPHIKGRTKDRISTPVIVADVSGSVSDEELSGAIGECLHICKLLNTELTLVQIDTQPHKPEVIRKAQSTFKRKACGGTELAPAIDMLKQHNIKASNIIVITDGGIPDSDVEAYQATGLPIIWLITSDGTVLDGMNDGLMRTFTLKA